jgi:6-pyruvoyltetrahydropterin/6-carboxytetrahydropterin synthase
MPRYLVSAETTFSAAHTLPGVELCERLHGHNWRVRLTVTVDETALDPAGMGLDFRIVEQLARDTVADFDHRYLNDLAPFRDAPPTAERIAKVVSDRAADRLGRDGAAAAVEEVEVWETSAYRVVYRPQ